MTFNGGNDQLGIRPGRRKNDRGAALQATHQRMAEREAEKDLGSGKNAVSRPHPEILPLEAVGNARAAMGMHDGLGPAGGAGGVQPESDFLRIHACGLKLVGLSREKSRQWQVRGGRRVRAAHNNDQRGIVQTRRGALVQVEKMRVNENHPAAAVLDDVEQVARGEPHAERDGDGAHAQGAEIGGHQLGRIVHQEQHAVAACDALCGKRVAVAVGVRIQLGEADRPVFAQDGRLFAQALRERAADNLVRCIHRTHHHLPPRIACTPLPIHRRINPPPETGLNEGD